MSSLAVIAVGFLVTAALFGSITVYGLITGKMLAFLGFAHRDEDQDRFWGWAIINGITTAASALAFLMILNVGIFSEP